MLSKLTRREFVKGLSATAGTVALYSNCSSSSKNDQELSDLFPGFQNPPAIAKPFFRWWWNGNRVTKKEITRELELMANAGAGGVEINPIALHEIYGDPPQRALEWLSNEWNDMIKHAVNECSRLGMYADLIVGTGWPFGGEFLDDKETIQGLELKTFQFTGPSQTRVQVFAKEAERELLQVTLAPKNFINISQSINLTNQVKSNFTLDLDIPNGEYILYVIIRKFKFREVLHGAPGAAGPVLDHFNKNAVFKYLNNMSEKLNLVLGGKLGHGFRSMFCDSIELNGANWTSDVPQEFRNRRSYDVLPYLPFLLDKEKKSSPEFEKTLSLVRYDYSKTLGELFIERFIVPFHEWCLQNGTKSRYQAYGTPWLYTDLLDGYLVPDIPEGDQWLFNKGWVPQAQLDELRYATWNKYASAGGRLTGKKIISCEAMTNTSGVFEASLEYLKQGTDINIITGINHLVLHGFNYSPPEVPFPGWIRYGTYFNENNPWWPHVKMWMDYTARLSYVFQESTPVADVAIMGPTADVWSEFGLDRNPWITTPKYLHALWQAFNHHGYFADYVNPSILENATFEDGKIVYGPMSFQLLVLANVRKISPNTASALLGYVEQGGKIVFLESLPDGSPGFVDNEKHNKQVFDTIEKIVQNFSDQILIVRDPVQAYPIPLAGKVAKEMKITPSVKIDNPDPKLFFIRQKVEDTNIYFFSNMDREKEISSNVSFPFKGNVPWRWDAETGEKQPYPTNGTKNQFELHLAPLESLLLVFENKSKKRSGPQSIDNNAFIELVGPWYLNFEPVKGKPFKKVYTCLFDFAKSKEYKDFAGNVTYRTEFEIGPDIKEKLALVIGKVNGCAEVILNGKSCGVQWWGKKILELDNLIKRSNGKNILEIKVSTLLLNYCASLPNNKVAKLWTTRRGRSRRVSAGLLGPVQLFRIMEKKEKERI